MSGPTGDTAALNASPARANTVPAALFFREFCRHPGMIGSIIPSSGRLIDRMLSKVDWATTKLVVEYGPGVGTFTRPILERLAPDAHLVAIDTNPTFVDHLSSTIADDRLILVEGSAVDVGSILEARGLGKADYVVSGLPFSTLPPGVGEAIVQATQAALKPGGSFGVYQYSRRILSLLRPVFRRIDKDFELLNIPPVHIYWGRKDGKQA